MFNLVVNNEYVTSWDLKQYIYCPVIPWLKSNYLVEEPMSKSMELGKLGIEEKELISNELELPKPIRFEVFIVSKKLRIAGVVDIIAGEKRLVVVEVKKYFRRKYEHFKTQLNFYAYLVTKELGPVTTAILKLGNEVIKYRVEAEEIKKTEELIKKVREVKQSPTPPITNQERSKCLNCWYRRYCIRANL